MGGEITLQSQPGKGSAFTVILTFGIDKTTADNPMAPLSRQYQKLRPRPELQGVRILLVEDDEMNRFFGVEVEIADSGATALELLEKGTFDLVFMDISMPEMNGYETTQRIRQDERFAHLPIVALTAHVLCRWHE